MRREMLVTSLAIICNFLICLSRSNSFNVSSKSPLDQGSKSEVPKSINLDANSAFENESIAEETELENEEFIEDVVSRYVDRIGNSFNAIFGIIGNSLSLLTLCRKNMLKNVSTIYFIGLSTADLLLIIIGLMCRHVIRGWFGVDPTSLSIVWCKIWYQCIYTMSTWSSWILVVVSTARCIAIFVPLKAHLILTHRKAKIQVVVIFIVIALMNIQLLFSYTLNEVASNDENATVAYVCNAVKSSSNPAWNYYIQEVRPALNETIHTFLPFTSLLVCNIVIIIKMIKASRKRAEKLSQSEHKNVYGVLPTLLGISFAFIILRAPIGIMYLWQFSLPVFYSSVSREAAVNRLLWGVAICTYYMNHTINFVLYLATGSEFRREFKEAMTEIKDKMIGPCTEKDPSQRITDSTSSSQISSQLSYAS